MAMYCAWRVRGALGALVGGVCFITPRLIIIGLAAIFINDAAPGWIAGIALGAGATGGIIVVWWH